MLVSIPPFIVWIKVFNSVLTELKSQNLLCNLRVEPVEKIKRCIANSDAWNAKRCLSRPYHIDAACSISTSTLCEPVFWNQAPNSREGELNPPALRSENIPDKGSLQGTWLGLEGETPAFHSPVNARSVGCLMTQITLSAIKKGTSWSSNPWIHKGNKLHPFRGRWVNRPGHLRLNLS